MYGQRRAFLLVRNIDGLTIPACHMSTASDWLHHQVWPEIEAMMLNDALYRTVINGRRLTKKFTGPTAKLLQDGYLTQQMITIRRLCDVRRDVISLRRVLMQAATEQPGSKADIDRLSDSLTECDHVCDQVNSHVAHTANPQRAQNFVKWDLEMQHLEDAHKVICRAAIVLERDILRIQNRIELIPSPWRTGQRWAPCSLCLTDPIQRSNAWAPSYKLPARAYELWIRRD